MLLWYAATVFVLAILLFGNQTVEKLLTVLVTLSLATMVNAGETYVLKLPLRSLNKILTLRPRNTLTPNRTKRPTVVVFRWNHSKMDLVVLASFVSSVKHAELH